MDKDKAVTIQTATDIATRPIERGSFPHEPIQPATYTKTYQRKPINGLISSSTARGQIQIDAIENQGMMRSDGIDIFIEAEAIQDINQQTMKVLTLLLTELTEQLPRSKDKPSAEAVNKARRVSLPLSRYMELCKVRDVKEARAQLNKAIKALYAVSFEWDEPEWTKPEGKKRRTKVTIHHRMRITDHTITQEEGNPIRRGVAEFRFSFDMAEYLCGAYIMPYPEALLSVNTHNNPYSFAFGWKLCTLHNMNFGKKTQDTTTVQTLLTAAKGIPRYEDIVKTGHIYERIISRFDRDLAALEEAGVLSVYWYYTDEGERIERAQLGTMSYAEFIRLNVHYELRDYPDQTPRLEEKRKRIAARISRSKSAAKKKAEEATAETASSGDGER